MASTGLHHRNEGEDPISSLHTYLKRAWEIAPFFEHGGRDCFHHCVFYVSHKRSVKLMCKSSVWGNKNLNLVLSVVSRRYVSHYVTDR